MVQQPNILGPLPPSRTATRGWLLLEDALPPGAGLRIKAAAPCQEETLLAVQEETAACQVNGLFSCPNENQLDCFLIRRPTSPLERIAHRNDTPRLIITTPVFLNIPQASTQIALLPGTYTLHPLGAHWGVRFRAEIRQREAACTTY